MKENVLAGITVRKLPRHAGNKKKKNAAEGDVQEHTVSNHGESETSATELQAGQQMAERDQQCDQCAARQKLRLMNNILRQEDNTKNEMERCFFEFGCLKTMVSVVACQHCGGSLHVQFGDKMGYSLQIRLACQVWKLFHFSSVEFSQFFMYMCNQHGTSLSASLSLSHTHSMYMKIWCWCCYFADNIWYFC